MLCLPIMLNEFELEQPDEQNIPSTELLGSTLCLSGVRRTCESCSPFQTMLHHGSSALIMSSVYETCLRVFR